MTGDIETPKPGGSVPRTRRRPEATTIEVRADSSQLSPESAPAAQQAGEIAPAPAVPEATAAETPPEPLGEAAASAAAEAPAPAAVAPQSPSRPQGESSSRGLLAAAVAGLLAGGAAAGLVGWFMPGLGQGDTSERLAALESGLRDKATLRAQDTADRRIGANEGAIQQIRGEVDALGRRLAADAASGDDKTRRLEAMIAELQARPAVTQPAPAPPAAPPAPPLGARESAVMALAWLTRDAVIHGAPFARELAALSAAGADPALLAALKPFAEAGAPTPAMLAARLAPLAEALSRPIAPAAGASLGERLTSGLARLYRVQGTGETEGTGAAALAARAEAALRRDALPEAAAALQALPATAPGELKSLADTVRARLAAGQAADALLARSVDRLIATTQLAGGQAR